MSLRAPAWGLLALAGTLLVALPGGAEEAALAAARVALASGAPVDAQQVLRAASDSEAKRLLTSQIELALGHPDHALVTLGINDPAQARAALLRWPAELQGEAAQTAAEALLAAGTPAPAPGLIEDALAWGGERVEVDRCLALYLDAQLQAGREDEALLAAEKLWHGWPRSPYRAHGGLILAHAWAATRTTQAREILASIRVDPAVPPDLHLAAADELCAILCRIHPGQCRVVAGQELAFASAHQRPSGRLALWQALALVQLDPPAGITALRALPVALAHEPAVADALASASATQAVSVAMRCENAQSLIALGRIAEARAALEPLAVQDGTALATLLELPGVDPSAWCGVPAASAPRAAVVLAAHLATAARPGQAWLAVQPALPRQSPAPWSATMLVAAYWASLTAPDAAERARWQGLLLAQPVQASPELGLAWCAQAQLRQAAGQDATAAWLNAARCLPEDHPYFPEASYRAASGLAAAADDSGALAALRGSASWGGDDQAHLRCRFLLAQLAARQGRSTEALEAARSLLPRAHPEQQQRLEALIHQLTEKSP